MAALVFKKRVPFLVLLSTILSLLLAQGVFVSRVIAGTVSPPRIELAANPGQEIKGEFKLYNDQNTAQTFYFFPQDFEAQDETGNPKFLTTQDGIDTWVKIQASVNLPPKQEAVIPFALNIPGTTEPGGYFVALFATTLPPQERSNQVGVASRVGTLVFLRVNGDIPEGISILEFGTKDKQRFYTELPITFYYRFQNSGTDRILPLGDVIINNVIGKAAKLLKANGTQGNILPKSIRRFETTWATSQGPKEQDFEATPPPKKGDSFWSEVQYQWNNFAFGPYTAHLNVVYGNISSQSASATYTIFVIPWQLLSVSIVILTIAIVLLIFVIKKYNRFIVNRAKKS